MTNVDDKVTSQMTGIGQDFVSGSSPSFGLSQSKGSSSLNFGRIPENGEDAFKWIANQVKGLQTAISVPLLQVVKTFEGDSSQFKQWVKDIEKYAQMARLDNTDIPRIALMTCTGTVGDFVKRYLDEIESKGGTPDWPHLKRLMKKRYGEITDNQRAMTELRKIKQMSEESVQLYSERLLRLAEDAYSAPFDEREFKLVQKQLVDIFCDGLCHDYLRMKVMRCDPQIYEEAVEIAMKEQNLRTRFNLRSNEKNEPQINDTNSDLVGSQNLRLNRGESNLNSQLTMRVNKCQNTGQNQNTRTPLETQNKDSKVEKLCYRCHSEGHTVWECPLRENNKNIKSTVDYSDPETDENEEPPLKRKCSLNKHENESSQNKVRSQSSRKVSFKRQGQNPSDIKNTECWNCHMKGHFRRNCPNRRYPDRYSALNHPNTRSQLRSGSARNQGNLKALFKRKPLERAENFLNLKEISRVRNPFSI